MLINPIVFFASPRCGRFCLFVSLLRNHLFLDLLTSFRNFLKFLEIRKLFGMTQESWSTDFQPAMFDMHPFGGKKVPCTKYQNSCCRPDKLEKLKSQFLWFLRPLVVLNSQPLFPSLYHVSKMTNLNVTAASCRRLLPSTSNVTRRVDKEAMCWCAHTVSSSVCKPEHLTDSRRSHLHANACGLRS